VSGPPRGDAAASTQDATAPRQIVRIAAAKRVKPPDGSLARTDGAMATTTWVGRPMRAMTTTTAAATRRGVVASMREFSRHRLACSGRTLGYVFILLVCVIWVAASFLVSDLEARGVSPVMMSFLSSSTFMVLVPARGGTIARGLRSVFFGQNAELSAMDRDDHRDGNQSSRSMYTFGQHAKAALVTAPIWVLCQLAFDYSLLLTTVTANSMLSASNVVFTFIFAVFFRLDKFTWVKSVAIVVFVIGSVLVTLAGSDGREEEEEEEWKQQGLHVVGNILSLAFAALYALYTTLLKVYLSDDTKTDMTLFLALMGIANVMCFVPIFTLFHLLDGLDALFESLTTNTFWLIIVKSIFDNVLNDYLWARSILLTSPTVASIGLSLQIPMAAGVELCVRTPVWASHLRNQLLMAAGTACVLIGFFGVVLSKAPSHNRTSSRTIVV